jgi:hypothetical protein
MHLTSETALDLTDGRLTKEQAGIWNEHLSMCNTCATEIDIWRRLAESLTRSHLKSAFPQDLEKARRVFSKAAAGATQLRRLVASLVFDSFQQPAFAGARGAPAQARQLVLRTEEFDIHIKIWGDAGRRQLLGQVLHRSGEEFVGAAQFHLLKGGERLDSTLADEMGEFQFTRIPDGELSLQIDLPHVTVVGSIGNPKWPGDL